ncbi:unnamed protein product, partial [Polarella glacialis]
DWPCLGTVSASRREQSATRQMHHRMGMHPTPCSVSLAHGPYAHAKFVSVIRDMQSKPGVYFFSATAFFCVDGLCDYNVPGRAVPAFSDRSHLNAFTAAVTSLLSSAASCRLAAWSNDL